MAEAKNPRRDFRILPSDEELFRRAAALVDESLSEFLIHSGRERAERLLADRPRFVLDRASWDDFMQELDRPAEVKPAAVELLRRPRPESLDPASDQRPAG